MKHEININPFKEEGVIEVSKVDGFQILKEGNKKFISFGIQDMDGMKHVFNFDIELEPHVNPGTRIKIRFTKSIDLDFAEIDKTRSEVERPATHTPVPPKESKKPFPKLEKKAIEFEKKSPVEPKKTDDFTTDDSFIEFDTPDDKNKTPISGDELFQVPDKL